MGRTLNAESQDEKNSAIILKYKEQVEGELSAICNDVLSLLRDNLIDEDIIAAVNKWSEDQKSAADYYKQAFELSEKVLEPTHPIRLGLALNYSVCYYEILKDKKKACQLAKDAFDEAISKLDKLEEADYKDSTLIMQLLRDNLTLWTSTDGDGDDENSGGDDGD